MIQQAGDGPLQPVMAGRYHDRFARGADGRWHFTYRDYSLHDLPGDMSRHSRNRPAGRPAASPTGSAL
ncbi:MAG: hypothetical protein WCY11_15520 [Novosphingobium sp.]